MGGSRIYVGFIEEGFYVQSSTWGLAGFTWCLIKQSGACENRFKGFLIPGAKPLPEQLIFIAREQFFDLDRISGFWRDHVAVLEASWCGI